MKAPIIVPQLNAVKNGDSPEDQDKIDEAVEESFPASDPPSTSVPGSDKPPTPTPDQKTPDPKKAR